MSVYCGYEKEYVRRLKAARGYIIWSSQQLSTTRKPILSRFATGNMATQELSNKGQSLFCGFSRKESALLGGGEFLAVRGFFGISYHLKVIVCSRVAFMLLKPARLNLLF